MPDLDSLQRNLEDAKVRRYEALRRHGADSTQFAAANEHIAAIERRIKEVRGG